MDIQQALEELLSGLAGKDGSEDDEVRDLAEGETVAHYLYGDIRGMVGESLHQMGKKMETWVGKEVFRLFAHPTDYENKVVVGFGDDSAIIVSLEEAKLSELEEMLKNVPG